MYQGSRLHKSSPCRYVPASIFLLIEGNHANTIGNEHLATTVRFSISTVREERASPLEY